MAEILKRTEDGAFRDSFGTTYRLASEGYVCPIKSRVLPLGTSASHEDEEGRAPKAPNKDGPQYV